MPKEILSDFERGYEYARRRYAELAATNSAGDILELAAVLSRATGENAELARGMAAYYEEVGRRITFEAEELAGELE
jgi:hypothetical protein